MAVIEVTTSNFEQEVLQADKPVLVDFWASWCGPCRMLGPIVDEIAEENTQIKVCKVNIDENEELAVKYGISAIPTLLAFQNGEKINQTVGVMPKQAILDMFQ